MGWLCLENQKPILNSGKLDVGLVSVGSWLWTFLCATWEIFFQPIRSVYCLVCVVTGHQCGISVIIPQRSFCKKKQWWHPLWNVLCFEILRLSKGDIPNNSCSIYEIEGIMCNKDNVHPSNFSWQNLCFHLFPFHCSRFINLAHTIGLYVIVRPGPFICAEWEFGGFPRQDYSWIINQPFLQLKLSVMIEVVQ